MNVFKKYWIYIFLFLITIPSVFFLLKPGFYEPHDLHHFADIYEMYRSLQSGQFPPRWEPDFLNGYGYPLFNFYYVLPFYLGAMFFAIFGSLQFSFEAVFIVSAVISVIGMYLFLREFFGKWASLVGSILFLYTPYRAVQIYVRGAMGEALALSLLPFVFWQITKVIKNPSNKKLIATSSLTSAFFILSHNYFWALVAPWMMFFIFLLVDRKKLKKTFFTIVTVGLLSLGISAYWWFPALVEQSLVSSVTPFPSIDHFPFVRQLIIPSWGYGSSVWGPGDEISFQVGVINWIVFLILFALLLLKKVMKRPTKNIAFWSLIGFLTSLYFMNMRSYPLWKLLPLHDFIQFPWRLLFLTTFFTSVMAALVVEAVKPYKKILGWGMIVTSFVLTISYFRPSKIFYKGDDEYLSRFFADRTIKGEKKEVSREYLQYSEDYLLLPYWVEAKPLSLPMAKIESEDVVVTDIFEINPVRWKATVSSESGGKVSFNSLYFPGWFAEIDGQKNTIIKSQPYGQIEVIVSSGVHELEFYWSETPLRKFADLVSMMSLVVVGYLLWYEKERVNKKQTSR